MVADRYAGATDVVETDRPRGATIGRSPRIEPRDHQQTPATSRPTDGLVKDRAAARAKATARG